MDRTSLFAPPDSYKFGHEYLSYRHILTDRKSKYTATGGIIQTKADIKPWIKKLLQDKQFAKATHNSYAWRVLNDDGSIQEGRNDDGETGAGKCILRELQREQVVDGILVVTRYYGGVKLHGDRFRNVIDVSKMFLDKSQ